MKYKNIVFEIVDMKNGTKDTALDVRSLAHAINCSEKSAYCLAKDGGRFKNFLVKPLAIEEFMKEEAKR